MNRKQEAICHYTRMIGWAKTQPENDYADVHFMEDQIQENWESEYCSYCNHYESCKNCELRGICGYNSLMESRKDCLGYWHKMNISYTWKYWLVFAEKILDFIKIEG